MKTCAVIHSSGTFDGSLLKEVSGCEQLIVLMNGDYTADMLPYVENKTERAEFLCRNGADLVIEIPPLGASLRPGLRTFSISTVLRKLQIIDVLVLPYYVNNSPDLYEELRSFLFQSPTPYQKRLQILQQSGINTEEDPSSVYEEFVAGSGIFASIPANRQAVDLENTLRMSYSSIRIQRLPLSDVQFFRERPVIEASTYHAYLKEKISIFQGLPADDIFGNTSAYQQEIDQWCQGGPLPVHGRKTGAVLRRCLVHTLCGYRKSDHSIASMYGYAPYINILAGSNKMLRQLREHSWLPIKDEVSDKEVLLQGIEDRMHHLWEDTKNRLI